MQFGVRLLSLMQSHTVGAAVLGLQVVDTEHDPAGPEHDPAGPEHDPAGLRTQELVSAIADFSAAAVRPPMDSAVFSTNILPD